MWSISHVGSNYPSARRAAAALCYRHQKSDRHKEKSRAREQRQLVGLVEAFGHSDVRLPCRVVQDVDGLRIGFEARLGAVDDLGENRGDVPTRCGERHLCLGVVRAPAGDLVFGRKHDVGPDFHRARGEVCGLTPLLEGQADEVDARRGDGRDDDDEDDRETARLLLHLPVNELRLRVCTLVAQEGDAGHLDAFGY